jgi:O-antigen/teichoic acid export membrane protein
MGTKAFALLTQSLYHKPFSFIQTKGFFVYSKSFINNSLIKSGIVVVIASVGVNFLNYIFNVIIARLLQPHQFGEVTVLVGLTTLMNVPATTLTTVMAKHISYLKGSNNTDLVSTQTKSIERLVLVSGFALLAIFWFITPFISSFLKIHTLPIYIFGLLLPLSLLTAVNTGVLQGLQQFNQYSLKAIITTVLKLVLSIAVILAGFVVSGVMGALVISTLIAYIYGYQKVSQIISSHTIPKEPYAFSLTWKKLSGVSTIFMATMLLTLLSSIDITLAKHFLPSDTAGFYSALSVSGKIISYGSSALVAVMFPLLSHAIVSKNNKERYYFFTTLKVVVGIAGVTLLLFILFPKLVVSLLLGSSYLQVASFLPVMAIAMFLNTISIVFINYFMAHNSKRYLYGLGLVIAIYVISILFFHATITNFVNSLLFSSILLTIFMSALFLLGEEKR